MSASNLIVTLTGPSCAGKSTLKEMLTDKGFVSVIGTTTRPPRAGETNGEHYHFIDKSMFKRLIEQGYFIEWAMFDGQYYGTSAAEFQRALNTGKPVVIIFEPLGLAQFRAYAHAQSLNAHSIFIDNPVAVTGERFLKRFAADLRTCGVLRQEPDYDKWAKRLAAIIEHEQQWRADAWDERLYEWVLASFDESNSAQVVNVLVDMAQEAAGVPA